MTSMIYFLVTLLFLLLFSLVDQRHKQTLTFNGGSAVGNFDGKLLVASASSVYRLKPVSIQIQIEVRVHDRICLLFDFSRKIQRFLISKFSFWCICLFFDFSRKNSEFSVFGEFHMTQIVPDFNFLCSFY